MSERASFSLFQFVSLLVLKSVFVCLLTERGTIVKMTMLFESNISWYMDFRKVNYSAIVA